MFYSLLDIAAINSYTLFKMNVPKWNEGISNARKLSLHEIGLELLKPCVEERSRDLKGLQLPIICAMGEILGKTLEVTKTAADEEPTRKARCYICLKNASNQRARDNITKTKLTCASCGLHLCKRHSESTILCAGGKCHQ